MCNRHSTAQRVHGTESTCQCKRCAGIPGSLESIPGSERTPGVENGNPLQYSCLDNSIARGAWWVTVHGIAKSQTGLSTEHTGSKQQLERANLKFQLQGPLI